MSVPAELVLRARAELLADLGHEPTLTAVAKCASVSVPTVHNVYLREGLNTRAGQGAETVHRVITARAELLESLGREPARSEVANRSGLSAGRVSTLYVRLKLDPAQSGKQALGKKGVRDRMLPAREALRAELGREPTQSQLARRLGVSRQRVSQLVLEARKLADSL